ncbi:unnamed protein product [Ectocarpus sp. CCAP 1310/34]|nr:unnamed protein product [Ectocarpus sp. CCAP 1310/34]
MSSSADNDREERFKHILQPIRDLAQNWDVDIATSLEDYLEDLEHITITLDGGASKVNFAEAALLIQGSTCVYSRKVEHVYQLVQRTIDFLTQQNQQNNSNAAKSKGGDGDVGDDSIVGGDVRTSGTLLIEGGALDESLFAHDVAETSEAARASDFWRGLGREGDGGLKARVDGERWTGSGMDMGGGDDDDDSDGGGGGFDGDFGPGDDFDDARDDVRHSGGEWERGGRQVTRTRVVPVDGPRTPEGSVSERRELRQRESKEKEVQKVDKAPIDPWAALDPHDPGRSQARPIRKGRTYKIPAQLRKRRGGKKMQGEAKGGEEEQKGDGGSWVGRDGRVAMCGDTVGMIRCSDFVFVFVSHFCNVVSHMISLASLRRYSWSSCRLSVPLLGLAYPEFQYVSNRERQRKAAQTRLARQQARVFMGREDFLPDSAPPDSAGMNDVGTAYDGYGSDGSYGSDGGGGYADFGDQSDGDGDIGGYGDGGGEAYGGGDGEGGAGVAPISLEGAFRNKPQTYEDLCRNHIEAFMRGTEKYAHETQLSKRVGAWQEKLEPLMESQEKRQAFDIHAYGQSVLSRVASVLTPAQRARAHTAVKGVQPKMADNSAGSPEEAVQADTAEPEVPLVDFGTVVAGKERFDVCRLFLASLQLANNGNVRLFHGDNAAEQETTPFRLELLTLQNSDNMSGYFAPSASAAGTGPENVPANGATKKGTKNGARKGAEAKIKSGGRRGGRGGVVGTKESPSMIQAAV